jgi:hypothetical protein
MKRLADEKEYLPMYGICRRKLLKFSSQPEVSGKGKPIVTTRIMGLNNRLLGLCWCLYLKRSLIDYCEVSFK